MDTSRIDKIHSEAAMLLKYLEDNKQLSHFQTANETATKFLLMAAASYFEFEIIKMIRGLAERKTGNNEMIVNLVERKALFRNYHTLFDWDKGNANKFFALFGPGFSKAAAEDVKQKPDLEKAIIAFLNIGRLRNELAHKDFSSFDIEKTLDEVRELFHSAINFLRYLSEKFS